MILSLLRARSADTLDTVQQQKVAASAGSGFTKEHFCQFDSSDLVLQLLFSSSDVSSSKFVAPV